MKVINTIAEMQQEMVKQRSSGRSIGFVPTMGYLHKGHLTLVEAAREENDLVVLSIFVNPLQFGPAEDYGAYPRDFDRDEELAADAGVDYVFYPHVKEMYPSEMTVSLKVEKRTDVLCGRSRPGHFDGVATVLIKLFNITLPHRSYFGLKDAQQVAVVKGLVEDLNFPVEIREVGIVREEDGLAKSSRNVKLTRAERDEAPAIYSALKAAGEKLKAGELDAAPIIKGVKDVIESRTSGVVDYVELYKYPELTKTETLSGKMILAAAVKFSKVRLIDNVIIKIN
ncbi:pantoate--beta-alanine ligase [Bacillus marinisedimentorum]|uniref:pantoate--beta-alanine ligase n=1 Tax=Bacillus marinisedimentorum TaxID=1821260 RepID=UPI000872D2FC|nr:pantoate--beta-alanine ligase [Bacillus marinisedimentorum]